MHVPTCIELRKLALLQATAVHAGHQDSAAIIETAETFYAFLAKLPAPATAEPPDPEKP